MVFDELGDDFVTFDIKQLDSFFFLIN